LKILLKIFWKVYFVLNKIDNEMITIKKIQKTKAQILCNIDTVTITAQTLILKF
jgi:hypothetical protein